MEYAAMIGQIKILITTQEHFSLGKQSVEKID